MHSLTTIDTRLQFNFPGEEASQGIFVDFVEARMFLEGKVSALGKDEVSRNEILPDFLIFLQEKTGIESLTLGFAFQVYEAVSVAFDEFKKKLKEESQRLATAMST